MSKLRIINVDRIHALPGAPSEFDWCIVVNDEALPDLHPISGEPQPHVVYRGTLRDCGAFLKRKQA